MTKEIAAVALSFVLFTLGDSAHAQQPKKVPRIGYLSTTSMVAMSARTEAFQKGLR